MGLKRLGSIRSDSIQSSRNVLTQSSGMLLIWEHLYILLSIFLTISLKYFNSSFFSSLSQKLINSLTKSAAQVLTFISISESNNFSKYGINTLYFSCISSYIYPTPLVSNLIKVLI